MFDPRFRPPSRVQTCPICGNHLPAGALRCEMCGTDVSTASVLLSSSVKPLTKTSSRGRVVRRVLVGLGATLAVLAVIAWLGQVPVVAARVPAAKTLSQRIEGTITHALKWGRQQVAAITGQKTRKPATAQPKPAPKPAVTPPNPVPPLASRPAAPPPSTPGTADPKPTAADPPQPQAQVLPDKPASVPTTAPNSPGELYLAVRTYPPGAQVHLNATKVGTTPVTIKNVKPGTYTLKITRAGYVPVSKTVKVANNPLTLELTLKAVPPAVRAAAPPPPTRPATTRTGLRRPLAIGEKAPEFALKDRMGVIYSLGDEHGRKTVVLFVWNVDDPVARRAIKELNARSRPSAGPAAMVVVLQPDRLAIRNLVSAANLRVPLLFGTDQIARAYGIPQDTTVMYVISERGVVERRQVTELKSPGAVR